MLVRRLSIVLALAAGALLPAAGAAPGATAPTELDVFVASTTPGATTEHDVELTLRADAPATQKLEIYVPAGYAATLPAPGARFGETALAFRSGATTLRAGGAVTADDPAKYVASTCAPGAHAAVWLATATIAGQPAIVTIFVDPATPDVAAQAAYVLRACFDPPSTSGRQLASLRLDVPAVFTTPRASGKYLWRTVLTSYGAGDVVDPTRAEEAQALLPLPYRLTAKARYDRVRRRVTFSGTATAGRGPDARSPVHILVVTGSVLKVFGVTRTDAQGRFTFARALQRTTKFALLAGEAFVSDCVATIGPAPCASETISSSELTVVTVKVPKS